MRSIHRVALFLCGLALSAAAGQANPPTPTQEETKPIPRAPLPEGVFVQSGDIQVPAKDVEAVMSEFLTYQKKTNPRNVPGADSLLKARVQIAERLLQNQALVKYAKDHNLAPTPKAMTAFIDTVRAQMTRQGTTYEQMLIDTAQTDAEFREFNSAKMGVQDAATKAVTEEEVQKHFDANYTKAALRSAVQILVQYRKADSAGRDVTRSKEEARALAEDILAQLQAGKDFDEQAKRGDDAAGATKGVGYFPLDPKGKNAMTPEFAKAAYALKKVGDLSPVVESPYGFHIIKLTGLRDEEYRNNIRTQLSLENSTAILQPLFKNVVENEKFSEKLTALDAQIPKQQVKEGSPHGKDQ